LLPDVNVTRFEQRYLSINAKVHRRIKLVLKYNRIVDRCTMELPERVPMDKSNTNRTVKKLVELELVTVERVSSAAGDFDGVLAQLAAQITDDSQSQIGLARYFAKQGKPKPTDAARIRATTLFKEQLANDPKDAELADLLLIDTSR
jgi:hypothetical protein